MRLLCARRTNGNSYVPALNSSLSPNFTFDQAVHSDVAAHDGIDNITPITHEVMLNIEECAQELEKVRTLLNTELTITSWYRSAELNAQVGGVGSSAHVSGYAVDFVSPSFGSPYQICVALERYLTYLNIDQLILDRNSSGSHWVHVAFAPPGVARHETLTKVGNGYMAGIILSI